MNENKLHKAVVTLYEMLQKRSLTKATTALGQLIERPFLDTIKNKNDVLVIDVDTIRIIINTSRSWKVDALTKHIKATINEKAAQVEHYIIVMSDVATHHIFGSKNKITPYVESPEVGKTCEIFDINELQYNISVHTLVPEHTRITNDAEKEALLTKFGIPALIKLPLILVSDPMVRFIGGRPGDVIRIMRNVNSVGEHTLFRYCVR